MARGAWTTGSDQNASSIEPATATDAPPSAPPVALSAPAPNPSRLRTVATLTVPSPIHVVAAVYDALGREMAVVLDRVAVGRVDLQVDTAALAPGVYVLRVLSADGTTATGERFTVAR